MTTLFGDQLVCVHSKWPILGQGINWWNYLCKKEALKVNFYSNRLLSHTLLCHTLLCHTLLCHTLLCHTCKLLDESDSLTPGETIATSGLCVINVNLCLFAIFSSISTSNKCYINNIFPNIFVLLIYCYYVFRWSRFIRNRSQSYKKKFCLNGLLQFVHAICYNLNLSNAN